MDSTQIVKNSKDAETKALITKELENVFDSPIAHGSYILELKFRDAKIVRWLSTCEQSHQI